MKKLIIILGIACISASAIAQPAVRIGNMEIIVRKQGQDTTMQVNVLEDPCPPCPPVENETRSRVNSNTYKYHYQSGFGGVGFIMPDIGSGNYATLGGSSINFDIGNMHRYQLARWFALVGTLQYSYYNYKLHDAAEEPDFNIMVLNSRTYSNADISKQVFRSHNAGAGAFMRIYLGQPRRHSNDGVFVDFGIQGEWAFSKYYKLKTQKGGKEKIRDDYAFNPFNASYAVRVGMKRFSVYARYRFTDAFNSKALPLDLPPVTIGVHFL